MLFCPPDFLSTLAACLLGMLAPRGYIHRSHCLQTLSGYRQREAGLQEERCTKTVRSGSLNPGLCLLIKGGHTPQHALLDTVLSMFWEWLAFLRPWGLGVGNSSSALSRSQSLHSMWFSHPRNYTNATFVNKLSGTFPICEYHDFCCSTSFET